MTRNEILRRFRLVTIGYMLIATTLVAGLAIDYAQTQDIQASQITTCDVVTSTASVFVDFIRKEIALRSAREARPDVASYVKAFDEAEIAYWQQHTLPALKSVLKVHCAK
jgi:hypothetical protein